LDASTVLCDTSVLGVGVGSRFFAKYYWNILKFVGFWI